MESGEAADVEQAAEEHGRTVPIPKTLGGRKRFGYDPASESWVLCNDLERMDCHVSHSWLVIP